MPSRAATRLATSSSVERARQYRQQAVKSWARPAAVWRLLDQAVDEASFPVALWLTRMCLQTPAITPCLLDPALWYKTLICLARWLERRVQGPEPTASIPKPPTTSHGGPQHHTHPLSTWKTNDQHLRSRTVLPNGGRTRPRDLSAYADFNGAEDYRIFDQATKPPARGGGSSVFESRHPSSLVVRDAGRAVGFDDNLALLHIDALCASRSAHEVAAFLKGFRASTGLAPIRAFYERAILYTGDRPQHALDHECERVLAAAIDQASHADDSLFPSEYTSSGLSLAGCLSVCSLQLEQIGTVPTDEVLAFMIRRKASTFSQARAIVLNSYLNPNRPAKSFDRQFGLLPSSPEASDTFRPATQPAEQGLDPELTNGDTKHQARRLHTTTEGVGILSCLAAVRMADDLADLILVETQALAQAWPSNVICFLPCVPYKLCAAGCPLPSTPFLSPSTHQAPQGIHQTSSESLTQQRFDQLLCPTDQFTQSEPPDGRLGQDADQQSSSPAQNSELADFLSPATHARYALHASVASRHLAAALAAACVLREDLTLNDLLALHLLRPPCRPPAVLSAGVQSCTFHEAPLLLKVPMTKGGGQGEMRMGAEHYILGAAWLLCLLQYHQWPSASGGESGDVRRRKLDRTPITRWMVGNMLRLDCSGVPLQEVDVQLRAAVNHTVPLRVSAVILDRSCMVADVGTLIEFLRSPKFRRAEYTYQPNKGIKLIAPFSPLLTLEEAGNLADYITENGGRGDSLGLVAKGKEFEFNGRRGYLADVTNPSVMTWLRGQLQELLVNVGFDSLYCEPEDTVIAGDHVEVHSGIISYAEYARAYYWFIFDTGRELAGFDFAFIGAGSGRYPSESRSHAMSSPQPRDTQLMSVIMMTSYGAELAANSAKGMKLNRSRPSVVLGERDLHSVYTRVPLVYKRSGSMLALLPEGRHSALLWAPYGLAPPKGPGILSLVLDEPSAPSSHQVHGPSSYECLEVSLLVSAPDAVLLTVTPYPFPVLFVVRSFPARHLQYKVAGSEPPLRLVDSLSAFRSHIDASRSSQDRARIGFIDYAADE
eukprot:gene16919-25955_t